MHTWAEKARIVLCQIEIVDLPEFGKFYAKILLQAETTVAICGTVFIAMSDHDCFFYVNHS